MDTEHEHPGALTLGQDPLLIPDLVRVARNNTLVHPLPTQALPDTKLADRIMRVERGAAWIQAILDEGETAGVEGRTPSVVYAINTGSSDNAGRTIFRHRDEIVRLSRNLLLTHAIGTGEHLAPDAIRAAMLVRAHTLAQGYSGVRRTVINTLVKMLNRDVLPAMPAQGSLGASGDLAPLAHLALVLSAPLPGEKVHPGSNGQAYLQGTLLDGAEAMKRAGIPRLTLGAKEGVALINGMAVSAGIGVLAWHDAFQVLATSEIVLALSMEALRGSRDAYLPHLHAVRKHNGQAQVAHFIYYLLTGSTLVRGDVDIDLDPGHGLPQDPYCLRAAPVVLGAVLDTLNYIEGVLVREINAVTDSPLIFLDEAGPLHLPRNTKAISGTNVHGTPLGYALDFMKIVMTDLASISERRVSTLLDGRLNRGLPPFLINDLPGEEGLNSGLMIAQYTAAALVSENKTLAHPASVDSVPGDANREDHVSMCSIAARHAVQVVANTQVMIALELLCAYQALELRLQHEPATQFGTGTAAVMDYLRTIEIAPGQPLRMLTRDVALRPYLDAMTEVVRSGALLDIIHAIL